MGLDMMVYAQVPDQKDPEDGFAPGVEVAYWRKASAVHRWFVEKCQNGVDECQLTPITREQLEALRAAAENVLAAPPDARVAVATGAGLLPQAGFFFGTTEMGDWYVEYLTKTVDQLSGVLNNQDLAEAKFFYRSSW